MMKDILGKNVVARERNGRVYLKIVESFKAEDGNKANYISKCNILFRDNNIIVKGLMHNVYNLNDLLKDDDIIYSNFYLRQALKDPVDNIIKDIINTDYISDNIKESTYRYFFSRNKLDTYDFRINKSICIMKESSQSDQIISQPYTITNYED